MFISHIFFSGIARARSGAMRELVGNRGLWEPHHTHYSPQYGDKGERKMIKEYSETLERIHI